MHQKLSQKNNVSRNAALQKYLKELKKFPVLSKEEEIVLIRKAQNGDENARKRIIECNLKFVVKIAHKYINRGSSFSELISEGNLGLIKALDRFDLSKGCKFITYAVFWIEQKIRNYLSSDDKIIVTPNSAARRIREIHFFISSYKLKHGTEPPIEEIASKLNLDENKVKEALKCSYDVTSTNVKFKKDNDHSFEDVLSEEKINVLNLHLTSEDPNTIHFKNRILNLVNNRIGKMSPRDAYIVRELFGFGNRDTKRTYADVGRDLKISREAVRQIAKRLLDSMRSEIEQHKSKFYL